MGERGLVAAFGVALRVFSAAAVLACIGPTLHARAEDPRAEIVASTMPSAVEPAASPEAAAEDAGGPAASPADEQSSIRPPAENTEGDSPAIPAVAPASEDVPDPADGAETAAPDTKESKPAETAAPAAPESEPKQPESASVPPAEPSGGTPAAATAQAPASGPDPLMFEIASKLKEPALRKGVASDDLAALEAFYAERNGAPLWITPMGFTARAQALIAEIQNAGNWGLPPDAFDLPSASDLPASTQAQAADEVKLALAVLKYARYARGGRLSPGKISELFDQNPDLVSPKTVLTEIAASPAPATYLTSLQPKQAQFESLRKLLLKSIANAKARVRKPMADPGIQRLIVNMERWRWMPADLGNYYVWNNVPSYVTRVMKNGKSIYVEKVIVGQPKYATPLFSANMRSIEFNPDWTVPDTIKFEDLAPRLRQGSTDGTHDISILTSNKLSVSYQGKPVDAATVDWSRANIRQYRFTQEPGPDNVLGVLKFNFPNRHAIYMHDTIQPELFSETERMLSHGCIRVRQPDRLASLLLAEDKGWSAQQVKDLLAKGKNSGVMLSKPVPVHLTYFTAVVDAQGKLQTFADIYGLDKKMAYALFGKTEAISETAAGAKQGKRSAWNGGGFGSISGLFGN
jgi:murein L,D-transpeptidase YcbB/YkuD